jgi:hypothetical protein
MRRLNRWVRVGVVIVAASLSVGTASVVVSASTLGSVTPQALVHVH